MTVGTQMQLDPSVVMQEATALEDHYKRRNLYLAQRLAIQETENQILLEKVSALEDEVARLSWKGDEQASDGET